MAGVALLIEAWLALAAVSEEGRDWSESERSRALDLLGIAADLRIGRTPVDGDLDDPGMQDLLACRRALALEEVERLEALRDEALAPLDDLDRRQALAGDVSMLSGPARLLLRYERDAWRRHREAMGQLRSPSPPAPPAAVIVAPPPAAVEPPEVRDKPAPSAGPSFEERRRALQAEAAPYRRQVTDRLTAMGFVGEDAWLEELERRLDAPRPARPPLTERTRLGATSSPDWILDASREHGKNREASAP